MNKIYSSLKKMNSQIIKNIKKLITLRYIQRANVYKILANQRVIEAIEPLTYKITSGEQAREIHGVGKEIAGHIDNILKYSYIPEIEHLSKEEKNKINIITDLMEIHGIGFKKAEKYYEKGITVNDLPDNIKKYTKELQKRVPREDITIFKEELEEIINKDIFIKIAGSYRRKLENCGDIDIIFYSPNIDKYKRKIIKQLGVIGTFSSGEEKFEGIIDLNENYTAVKVDLIFVSDINEYPYYLLYFTGNTVLNTRMRAKARKMGYHLANNEMLDSEKKRIYVKNEREIFELLDMPYLKPEDRNI